MLFRSHIADPATRALAARGRTLVVNIGCIGCHATNGDRGPDYSKHFAGGGVRIESHLGRFVSRNLTPDPDTGLARRTDDEVKRTTRYPLLPGAIPEFNRYEFSRPMLRASCTKPVKVFAHIAPYHGGPERITSTNGAGDAALSALLHDMSANRYHRASVPNSAKHVRSFLTYSSMSQVCRYANRVSFEVLAKSSPRLPRGLPEREDGLDEEAYWAR